MDPNSRDAMLVLSLTPGLGPILTHRCVEAMGSAQAVMGARVGALAGVRGIGAARAETIRRGIDELADGQAVAREKELIAQHRVTVVCVGDPDYPRLLGHIHDPPPLLYVRGRLHEDDALALAVVGTRRCTAYGREQADRLSSLCSQAGLCIVSGGARGIDAAAHRAALRVEGRTIAVLGSGLADPYPAEHRELFDAIAGGGAVVSEWPMLTPPRAENFPRRNRIISGMSLGVLVIEAPTGSGAVITARLAAEEHGREVMALPGRVDSRHSEGCHKMVREGWATLVTSAADVLDALGEAGQLLRAAGLSVPMPGKQPDRGAGDLSVHALTPTQRKLLEAMSQSRTLDQLAAETGLPVPAIQADITVLEIRGLIGREKGFYTRRR